MKLLEQDYKIIYDTIIVRVEDRNNDTSWSQELPVINSSIKDTITEYKNTLGAGYWVEYSGPGDTHKKTQKYKQLNIFDTIDEEYMTEVYPQKDETKEDFIKRFMSATKDEYPDIRQRFAIAISYWERSKETKTEDLKDDAKDYFGTVLEYYWRVGLYINTDGTILDGSGEKLGHTNGRASGQRSVDHREVADIMDDISGDDAMIKYLNEGNIRLMPESQGLELIKEPTEAQYATMARILARWRGCEIFIDISNSIGDVIEEFNYTLGPAAGTIIAELRKYFKGTFKLEEVLRYNDHDEDYDAPMFTTDSLYEMASVIKQSNISLRILWDRHLKRFFYGDTWDYIHRDLAEEAINAGYYGAMRPWQLDNYLDDFGKNIIYYIYTPKGLEKKTSGSEVGEDGYDGKFVYEFGTVTTRTNDKYKSSPLAKALGKYESHWIANGWVDDYRPNLVLVEDNRTALINKSRNQGTYKDQSRGKNRFERKKYSNIANAVKAFNKIDMNDFYKKDILLVQVPVTGETENYTVSIKMEGVVAEIAKNVKSNNNKFEYRTTIQALTKIFNTANIYVNCTCPDYLYNFKHWNLVNNVASYDSSQDPGPGHGIANPQDSKGRGCKHVLLTLNNGDWMMKVASVINNYTHYAEEHMAKAFLKLIFPKIYGIPADEMIEQGLIDDDKFLDSSDGLIDAINTYGANRGKYKKGSNKNPVTGTGGKAKKEPEKSDEEATKEPDKQVEKVKKEPEKPVKKTDEEPEKETKDVKKEPKKELKREPEEEPKEKEEKEEIKKESEDDESEKEKE